MLKIVKKYKFSIIQMYKRRSREIVNIGIVLYLNDEQTKYELFLPKNSFVITNNVVVRTEQGQEIRDFYQIPKSERSLENFPSVFFVTEPEYFTESRCAHSSIEGLCRELVNTFITIEELKRQEAELTEIDIDQIRLRITIDASLTNSQDMEFPGHTNVRALIQYPYYNEYNGDEFMEDLGYLDFVFFDTEYDDIFTLLDYSDETEHFIHLFNSNESLHVKYEKKIKKCYSSFFENYSINPIILTSAFIFEKYRGRKLFKKVYKKIISLLNIENSCDVVLLKAFSENDKETKKLKDYYEKEIGFVTLEKYMDGYIMCHPTSHFLLSDIKRNR